MSARKIILAATAAILIAGIVPRLFTSAKVQAASGISIITGTVRSAAGEKLGGVTVSAKAAGGTVTTSVFTDENGTYYFPALPSGQYDVWAQADTFETANGQVDLATTQHQNFVLKPLKDYERQLTGDQLLASLPDETAQDKKMKRVFRNSCTSCHQPNYILQNRFDAEGWTAMMDLMKRVNVAGAYQGADTQPAPVIDYYEKELAPYLAKVRGPNATSLKFKVRPRPSGDAARAVFTEYDVPVIEETTPGFKYVSNNGSDWSLGTPSSLNGAHGVHDAQADLDGNIWFSYNVPNRIATVGRVDAHTGAVKWFKVDGLTGLAANGHGITRDQQGNIWFHVSPGVQGGPGRLVKIDPATQKIDVYAPPAGTDGPTTVAGTIDIDGKDKVWVTTGVGAVRFDPDTRQFTDFKSPIYKNEDGIGNTYGLAADGDGNGWWAQMNMDVVTKGDIETGQATQVKIPEVASVKTQFSDGEKKMYQSAGSTWNTAMPWAEGPRRMGADKNGHIVWVCDWWGGNLAKIDTRTLKVTMVPLPRPDAQQPYQAAVDNEHNVWMNIMNGDEVLKYDPKSNKWTEYPFPTLGAETRYVSLLEKDGRLQVILPYSRARKVARITFRTNEDLRQLKAQVGQQEQVRGQ
jgi:virginiamycin B lyase